MWNAMVNRLLILLLIGYSSCIDLILSDNHALTINSSLVRDSVSISFSSRGPQSGSFWMSSPCFSKMQRHKFIHEAHAVAFAPDLQENSIVFNERDEVEYWVTIKHRVSENVQNSLQNFYPLQIQYEHQSYHFLLPAFPQPMSILPLHQFYVCQNALISVQKSDSLLDVAFFSKENPIILSGDWSKKSWSQRNGEIYFGRYFSNKFEDFNVIVGNSISCTFKLEFLEGVGAKKDLYKKQSYLLQDLISAEEKILQTRRIEVQDL